MCLNGRGWDYNYRNIAVRRISMTGTQNRPVRRFDREISLDEASKIIDEAPFAVVSTLDDDGFAYGVPVNPVKVDDVVYFHTTSGASRRNDNIRAHCQICLTFVSLAQVVEREYSCNYACALVEGKCTEVIDEKEKVSALQALAHKWAPTNTDERNTRYIDKHLPGCSVWRVDIAKISGKARKPKPAAM